MSQLLFFPDIEDCENEINELEVLNKHVSDILECRIEATLHEMERTALCEVPENDTMTPKEFLNLTGNFGVFYRKL